MHFIYLSRDSSSVYFKKLPKHLQCSFQAYRRSYWKEGWLYSEDGKKYRFNIGTKFTFCELLISFFKSSRLKLTYKISFVSNYTIEELRSDFINAVSQPEACYSLEINDLSGYIFNDFSNICTKVIKAKINC